MIAIYLITDGMYYKIGIASNPQTRLIQLQTGHPKELYFVTIGWRDNKETALFVEKSIHKGLKQYRQKGEWFIIPSSLLVTIINEINLAKNLKD